MEKNKSFDELVDERIILKNKLIEIDKRLKAKCSSLGRKITSVNNYKQAIDNNNK